MEEILFAAVIMWALGRVAQKKADMPPPQQRNSQTSQFDPQGNPGAPSSGQPVTGGPQGRNGSNGNTLKKFV